MQHIPYNRTIELYLIELVVLQIKQRRMSHFEIIEGEPIAGPAQPVHRLRKLRRIRKDRLLLDHLNRDRKLLRIGCVPPRDLLQLSKKVLVLQRIGRDVKGKAEIPAQPLAKATESGAGHIQIYSHSSSPRNPASRCQLYHQRR